MFKPTPVPEGIFSTNYYWYSIRWEDWHGNSYVHKWKESSSFINVADFAFYLTANVGATVTTTSSLSTVQSTAKPGDIVQLKNAGGEWYHSIIITGGTFGDRTYSGHSTDRLDREVSTLSASQYKILHIN